MFLKYKVGDLLTAAKTGEVGAIAHQCNCYCTMGAGIAPQIKKAFPEACAADLETMKGDKSKLGGFTVSYVSTPVVYNLYGQYHYGGGVDTDYDALYRALLGMGRDMNNYSNLKTIGLPKLGSGLAGGCWVTIEGLIKDTLISQCGLDVTIYVLSEDEIPDWYKGE